MATEKRWERQTVNENPFIRMGGRMYEKTYIPGGRGTEFHDVGIGGNFQLYQKAADELLRAQAAQRQAMQKYPEAALAGKKQDFELGAAEKLVQDKQALNALTNLGMLKEFGLGQFSPSGAGMESIKFPEPGTPGFIGPPAPISGQGNNTTQSGAVTNPVAAEKQQKTTYVPSLDMNVPVTGNLTDQIIQEALTPIDKDINVFGSGNPINTAKKRNLNLPYRTLKELIYNKQY